MLESNFVNVSLIILVAFGVSAVMRILRQPLIIGYIFTGIVVGPYFFDLLESNNTVGTFSQIGVALLLFTVGLHLNPKVIKEVGKASLITGIGQVIFTFTIGFFISTLLGFSTVSSAYISLALSFSSTIIIMKLLTDKGDIDSVYGKIAVGFLIVQDIIAVFALMFISSLSSGNSVSSFVTLIFAKGVAAVFVLSLFGFYALPFIMNLVAKSQEFLFLFSVSWCLAVASLFSYLNFSMEIGALFAGTMLSISPYSGEISSKLKPLRDFFIILFFIVIGSEMVLGDVQQNLIPIIIFSILVLIGNPLIVMFLMKFVGYTKRNGFLAGLTVAQISEFSIILIALGAGVGHLPREILSLVTMIALITIGGSTYMIVYSNRIYPAISKYLGFFENKGKDDEKKIKKEYEAILFGYNRIGFNILRSFKKIGKSYLVVDFNPETISALDKFRIPSVYGDAYDSEFLNELPLKKTKLIVSTIPDFETNLLLLETIRKINPRTIIILRAHSIEDAFELYRKGANYVLTPHFLGGEYIAKMIAELKTDEDDYRKEKIKHVRMLNEMIRKKKRHPDVERG